MPHTILVLPALLNERIQWPPYKGDASAAGAVARSKALNDTYRELALEYGISFVDAAAFAEAGADGLHLTPESHVRLGHAVAAALDEEISGKRDTAR